ncbi:MAG: extracellular solute-binding protein [Clostridia bacterium]|nr:extracellular solute-binding protein [Clostridia bacterium]
MKNFARLTAAAMCAVMLLGGCGSKSTDNGKATEEYVADQNLNAPGEFPVCKEKVTITVGIPKDPLVQDYDTNLYTKLLEEKMNCDIQFSYLPASAAEAQQKLELMVSAGGNDLPDVIVNVPISDSTISRYASKGFIVPLNEYYDNSAYYLNDVCEKEPELKKMITMTDGNIYVVPRYLKIMQNELGYRMWIYEPWLKKLGLEMPKTLDEFYNVLKAFKEQDPNGNGMADEIPLLGATNGGESWFKDFIAAAYQPIDPQSKYLYPENGKIKAAYIQPEYKEAIKYMNKLCSEGLLSPSSFTGDAAQCKQTVQNPNGVQVGAFTSMAPTYLSSSDERKDGYKILPPLTQEDGTGYSVYAASIPVNAFYITKNCKNPEAAFRMGDIMMSEEMTIHSRFGQKGTDWLEPTEGQKSMFDSMGYAAKINPVLTWGAPQNSHWQNGAAGYRSYELSFSTVDSGTNIFETEIANKLQTYMDRIPKEYITKLIYTEDEIDTVNEIQQNIDAYKTDNITRFIIGDLDIESGWDSYVDELKKIGVDELVKISQDAYDRLK